MISQPSHDCQASQGVHGAYDIIAPNFRARSIIWVLMVPKLILLFATAGWSAQPYSINFWLSQVRLAMLHGFYCYTLDGLSYLETFLCCHLVSASTYVTELICLFFVCCRLVFRAFPAKTSDHLLRRSDQDVFFSLNVMLVTCFGPSDAGKTSLLKKLTKVHLGLFSWPEWGLSRIFERRYLNV